MCRLALNRPFSAPDPTMNQATSYDQVSYDSHAFAATHPNRIGALARLHGIAAALPDAARVLELGCASGGNIMPMAVRCPAARFVGIDLSRQQIDEGRSNVARLGLGNIELICASIMDLDPALGRFDYIIAHGLFSWVPAEVQQKLLAVCRDHLADNGVAFISYNTFPGWHLGSAVRYMMQYHAANIADPAQKIGAAKELIRSLARLTPAGSAYAGILDEYSTRLDKAPDYYVFHEYLEESNRPLYFNQFVDQAHHAGLSYLCDAEVVTGLAAPFGAEATEFVLAASRGNLIDYEQYLDFVSNRKFRQSLLVRQNLPIRRDFDVATLAALSIAAPVRPAGPPAGTEYRVGEQTVLCNTPWLAAAIDELGASWPSGAPLQKIFDHAVAGGASPADLGGLASQLAELAGRRVIDLLLAPWPGATADAAPPCADAFVRDQAQRGEPTLVNRAHRPITVSPYLRDIVAQLDGKRSLPEVAESVARRFKAQGRGIETRQGVKLNDFAQMRQVILSELPAEISLLRTHGLIS